jgi:hypothetical protein
MEPRPNDLRTIFGLEEVERSITLRASIIAILELGEDYDHNFRAQKRTIWDIVHTSEALGIRWQALFLEATIICDVPAFSVLDIFSTIYYGGTHKVQMDYITGIQDLMRSNPVRLPDLIANYAKHADQSMHIELLVRQVQQNSFLLRDIVEKIHVDNFFYLSSIDLQLLIPYLSHEQKLAMVRRQIGELGVVQGRYYFSEFTSLLGKYVKQCHQTQVIVEKLQVLDVIPEDLEDRKKLLQHCLLTRNLRLVHYAINWKPIEPEDLEILNQLPAIPELEGAKEAFIAKLPLGSS